MKQSFRHTHRSTVALTSFRTGAVLDRQTPGGRFPTSPGITGLRISRPAGRCALTRRSRSADIAQTGLPPTPRNHPTTLDIRLPDIPEPLSLHIHSQPRVDKYIQTFTILLFYVSGLSPYCCSTCPGFHRTAVLRVQAFTVLLFYVSEPSPYCCSTCPGFHRTAVLRFRAFTVMLFYSYLSYAQTGIPMDLPNYPLNTIPNTCISI